MKTGLRERNRMAQELRRSVKRYRALIRHSGDALCRYEGNPVSLSLRRDELFDHVYRHAQVVECNDAFARMHGKKRARDMIGIRLADMLDRTDQQNVEFLRAVIRSDTGIQEIDCSERDAQGHVRWISRSGFRVTGNGRLLGAWFVLRDITRNKLAEEALRESEKRYRSIFNNSLDAILLTVPGGRILEANPAACRMFRRTEKELRRIGRAGLVDVDDPRLGPALAERAHAGFAREELTYMRRDGTRFTGDTSSGVFTGGDGLPRTSMVIRDTTDRKRIEETLREASQFNQQVIENAHEGIVVVGLDLRYRVWNPFMEKLSGIPAAEVLGRHPLEVFPFLRETGIMNLLETTLAGAEPRTIDFPYQIPETGRSGWASQISTRLRNSKGEIVGVISAVHEITERKRAEERLREYEKVVEGLQEMIVVIDRDYRYLIANRALLNYRGMGIEQVVGHSVAEVLDGEVFERVIKKNLDECFQGKAVKFELAYRYPELGERNLLVSYFPIEGAVGVDRVAAVLQDVTEPKRAEEALRESEERFRATFENAGIGMALVDTQGHAVKCNPALQTMLGYSEEELTRMAFTEFTHPDDQILDWELYRELGEGKRNKYEIEKRYIKKDGRIMWGHLIVSLVKPIESGPAYAIRMVEDITERKRAEEALRQSREQLRGLAARLQAVREEERTRVAREIHDVLAQELTRLKMDIVWLNRRLAQPLDDLKLKLLQEKLGVMTDLTDTAIRSVQKIATELRPVVLDSLGLPAAIEWQAKDFQANTGIQCEVILPGKDIPLDPDRSTAVFRILQESLTNVARHAEATSVEVQLRCEASQLTLSVRDDGCGILDSELNDPHSVGLLGMRERALLLGGQCQIAGRTGEGTVVEVRIPLPPHNGSQDLS